MPEADGIPIIEPRRRPPWWKRRHAAPTAWIALCFSLLSTLVSLWSVHVARQAEIAEHRPLLEITSFEFMNKSTLRVLGKNSGRSTALRPHSDIWCDLGEYAGFPPALKVEKSIPTGQMNIPDVASGAPFEITSPIPGELWFNQLGVRYTEDSSLRLRGSLRYEDARHDEFALPWCYESFRPKAQEKPGVIPCYDMAGH